MIVMIMIMVVMIMGMVVIRAHGMPPRFAAILLGHTAEKGILFWSLPTSCRDGFADAPGHHPETAAASSCQTRQLRAISAWARG
jgi:hypothetical protein